MNFETQLTKINSYNPKKSLIFSKIKSQKLSGNKNIEYQIIKILTKNKDGTKGELIIPTSRIFSYGISKNVFNGKETGYTFPLCLWNKDGATEEEIKWTDTFNNIVDCCIEHILSLDENEFSREELSREKGGLNPLYWKMEKVKNKKTGKRKLKKVDGFGPTLYAKIMYNNKDKQFYSSFYDMESKEITPLSILGKYCFTKVAIKIESIFIGQKISLQVKLYEAFIDEIKPKENKKLLRPKSVSFVECDEEEEEEKSESESDVSDISYTEDQNDLRDYGTSIIENDDN